MKVVYNICTHDAAEKRRRTSFGKLNTENYEGRSRPAQFEYICLTSFQSIYLISATFVTRYENNFEYEQWQNF